MYKFVNGVVPSFRGLVEFFSKEYSCLSCYSALCLALQQGKLLKVGK